MGRQGIAQAFGILSCNWCYVRTAWRDLCLSYTLVKAMPVFPINVQVKKECGSKEVKSEITDRNWGYVALASNEGTFCYLGLRESWLFSCTFSISPRAVVPDAQKAGSWSLDPRFNEECDFHTKSWFGPIIPSTLGRDLIKKTREKGAAAPYMLTHFLFHPFVRRCHIIIKMVLKQVCDPHWFDNWCHILLSLLKAYPFFPISQSIIQNQKWKKYINSKFLYFYCGQYLLLCLYQPLCHLSYENLLPLLLIPKIAFSFLVVLPGTTKNNLRAWNSLRMMLLLDKGAKKGDRSGWQRPFFNSANLKGISYFMTAFISKMENVYF